MTRSASDLSGEGSQRQVQDNCAEFHMATAVERFDALLTSTFHLKAFPFDTQKLEVMVHPFTSQQQFVTFVPSQLPVWTATEFNTYSSLETWQFKSPTFNFSMAAS
jgi:hypothetical protein